MQHPINYKHRKRDIKDSSSEDNDKLTYKEAFRIAKAFAERFFHGYEVLFTVHTDTPHKHIHFLIGNCHIETGRAFRRNERDLRAMSELLRA